MLILMNYVHWVFKRAQILTPMLTSLLNLAIIYLVRQAAKTPGVAREEGQWKSSRTPPQEEGGGCDGDERGKRRGSRRV